MPRNIIIVILIAITIFLVFRFFIYQPETKTRKIIIKGLEYNLEVAQTLAQKEKGLMNRSQLCSHCGMIFVSSFEIPQIFWMKNTLIPLDMIFLDKNGQVINIEKAIPQPNTNDSDLRLYQSTKKSKYVIELNAGDSDKIGLKPGDVIDLSYL